MKEIFLNLFAFQFLNSDIGANKIKKKPVRLVILTSLFVALFGVQVSYFIKSKSIMENTINISNSILTCDFVDREQNYFEILDL